MGFCAFNDIISIEPLLTEEEVGAVRRFLYYTSSGIDNSMLAPLDRETVLAVLARVFFPSSLSQGVIDSQIEQMLREVVADYFSAVKKASVLYLALDAEEAERLHLEDLPSPLEHRPYVYFSIHQFIGL